MNETIQQKEKGTNYDTKPTDVGANRGMNESWSQDRFDFMKAFFRIPDARNFSRRQGNERIAGSEDSRRRVKHTLLQQ